MYSFRIRIGRKASVWGKNGGNQIDTNESQSSPPGVHDTLLRRRGAYRPQALKARKLVAIYLYAPRVHAILIEQPRWKAPLTFGVGNATGSRFNENRGAVEGNAGVGRNSDGDVGHNFSSH